jgi:hypothetical protein
MFVQLAAAMALALATPDYASLTKEQAEAMSPEQLGRLLLPRTAPRIVKVIVHPVGMDAPWPSLQGVDLYSEAVDDHDGFCKAQEFHIGFRPVDPTVNPAFVATPMRADGVQSLHRYRFVPDEERSRPICDPTKHLFFNDLQTDPVLQKRAVRLLSEAVSQAKKGILPQFAYTFDDRIPLPKEERPTALQALASLPLGEIFIVRDLEKEGLWDVPKEYLQDQDPQGHRAEVVMDKLVVYMVLRSEGIERLVIIRQIPPPF